MAEARAESRREKDGGSKRPAEPQVTTKVGDQESAEQTQPDFKCPMPPKQRTAAKATRCAKPPKTAEKVVGNADTKPDNRQRLLRRLRRRAVSRAVPRSQVYPREAYGCYRERTPSKQARSKKLETT